MINRIINFSKLVWPEISQFSLQKRLVSAGDVFTSVYSTLCWMVGMVWLINKSDLTLLNNNPNIFLLYFILILIFTYLSFFMIVEFRSDRYGSSDGAFNSTILWAAVFSLGPTALWMIIVIKLIEFFLIFRSSQSKASIWNHYRNFSLNLAGFTVPYLAGYQLYEYLGGITPIRELSFELIGIALLAITANFLLFVLIWSPYFLYALYTQKQLATESNSRPLFIFFFFALALPTLAHPFSILATSLLSRDGLVAFLYFITGLLVIAFTARRFSWIAESNRQQSRQLERLDLLGREILSSSPDGSDLPNILEEHIQNMFPAGNLAIWINPGQVIFKSSQDWDFENYMFEIESWCQSFNSAQSFLANQGLPWSPESKKHLAVICCPILSNEGDEIIGGFYIELRVLAHIWDKPALQRLIPAIHSLTDMIASAYHQSEEYAKSITLQKMSQELQLAGQIQASFLPNQIPNIPGWQLAVTLRPAGGLSGDYFDFIPLSNNRLGILIADVADKGLGAALYMALSRTLLRTYAFEYHSRPDIVFSEANDRILNDARANLFITCFYGVLDPNNGTLMYCNAGHNPPFLLHAEKTLSPSPLIRTGIPIGIENEARWERKTIRFGYGDKLILYTDGITEAQNEIGEFYGEKKILEAAALQTSINAYSLQANIIDDLEAFMGSSRQHDDITLMILERENEKDWD